MRGSYGFACVCALLLAPIPMIGCSDTKGGGQGGNGGNGEQPCESPLSDYCQEPDCPTWDQAVAEADELGRPRCDAFLDIYSGPCGDLKYIFVGSLGGTIEYFDVSGALVAAERYNDVPDYCNETSFNIWYGPIPDCTRDPWNIWENFCKGSGYEDCASVSECGSVDESECLSRYNNLQCWARWNNYVECMGEGGPCESCAADYLPEWETCDAENGGAPERIDAEGAVNYDAPTELAMNASGFAFAVWTTWEGEIWTNRYTPNDGWGTAERVPTQGEGYVSSFPPPRVATANDGSAMLVWMENQPDAIWGSHFTPSSGWGPAELIDRGFERYGVFAGPDVAMDAQGNAIAVWRRSADEYEVVASRYTPGNSWSEAERIDDGSADAAYEVRIATAPDGAAIAVWTVSQTGGPNIFANHYAPRVGWETAEAIDDPCNDGNECTDDLCDPANGSCTYTPVADGTPCAGGAATCQSGVCST